MDIPAKTRRELNIESKAQKQSDANSFADLTGCQKGSCLPVFSISTDCPSVISKGTRLPSISTV